VKPKEILIKDILFNIDYIKEKVLYALEFQVCGMHQAEIMEKLWECEKNLDFEKGYYDAMAFISQFAQAKKTFKPNLDNLAISINNLQLALKQDDESSHDTEETNIQE
jgi:hypothetical protein